MGMEGTATFSLESTTKYDPVVSKGKTSSNRFVSESSVVEMHGMPWQTSIQATSEKSPELLYMPFWEWQMSFMKDNLSNLRSVPCTARESPAFRDSTTDLSYKENAVKGARIVNQCFTSEEYRKIRMTYYDAGFGCQVFNSLWYPQEDYNLPVLGIDLLSFGGRKFLAIVDFQPIHDEEKHHEIMYEKSIMEPIRKKYPKLQGQMSAKFYDETQFFSRQMLFSRFEDSDIITKDLFPAFQEYVAAHVDMVQTTEPNADIDFVRERVTAYDIYSAEKDPATGLFAAMFGKEWADEYVHGFLFSNSKTRDQTVESASPEVSKRS